jgi:hypothetical protein
MLNDSAADITVTGGSKDCNTVPSLQRVVEWCSICMDAFGLQVCGWCCRFASLLRLRSF